MQGIKLIVFPAFRNKMSYLQIYKCIQCAFNHIQGCESIFRHSLIFHSQTVLAFIPPIQMNTEAVISEDILFTSNTLHPERTTQFREKTIRARTNFEVWKNIVLLLWALDFLMCKYIISMH